MNSTINFKFGWTPEEIMEILSERNGISEDSLAVVSRLLLAILNILILIYKKL